jgi:tape measure domain-containing protein
MSQLEVREVVVKFKDQGVVDGYNKVTKTGDKAAAASEGLAHGLGDVERAGKRAGSVLRKDLGPGAVNALMGLKVAAAAAAGAFAYMGARAAASGIQIAAQRDAQIRGLGVLMGSLESARKHFNDLQQAALLPGVSLGPALEMSNMLQASRFSAEQATDAIKGFGNALALMGAGPEALSRIGVALAQMSSSPKPMQEEINQIREALPNIGGILDTIAQKTGAASGRAEDLAKVFATGRDFAAALVAEMKLLAEINPAESTFLNALNNMGQAFDNLKAAFGAGFIGLDDSGPASVDALAEALAGLEDVLHDAGQALGDYARAAAQAMAEATATGGPIGGGLAAGNVTLLPLLRSLGEAVLDLGQQFDLWLGRADEGARAFDNVREAGFGMGLAIAMAFSTMDKLQNSAFNAGLSIEQERKDLQTLTDQYRAGDLTTQQYTQSVHDLVKRTEEAIRAHREAEYANSAEGKAAAAAAEKTKDLAEAEKQAAEAAARQAEQQQKAAAATAEHARMVALLTGNLGKLTDATARQLQKELSELEMLRKAAAAEAARRVGSAFGQMGAAAGPTPQSYSAGVLGNLFGRPMQQAGRAPARKPAAGWVDPALGQLAALDATREAAERDDKAREARLNRQAEKAIEQAEAVADAEMKALEADKERLDILLNIAKANKDQGEIDRAEAAIRRNDELQRQERELLDARLKGIREAAEAQKKAGLDAIETERKAREKAEADRRRAIEESQRRAAAVAQKQQEIATLDQRQLAERYQSDLQKLLQLQAAMRSGALGPQAMALAQQQFRDIREPWTNRLQGMGQRAASQTGLDELAKRRADVMGQSPESFVKQFDDAMETVRQLRRAIAVVADPAQQAALKREADELDRLWSQGMRDSVKALRALIPGQQAKLIMFRGEEGGRAGLNQDALTAQVLGNAGLGLGGMLQQARLDTQYSEEQRLVGAIRRGGQDAGQRIAEAIRQALGDAVAGEVLKALDQGFADAA